MPCEASSLADIQLFDALDDDDRNALAGVIDSQKVAKGETLFQAGEPGDSLFDEAAEQSVA